MNDNTCTILLNSINLAVRMTSIFVRLEPKHRNRENIAVVSAYLWVIMVSVQSSFHIPQEIFLVFQGIFSCLFFLMLLISLQGSPLKKASLYVSAWLLAVLSTSLSEFVTWVLDSRAPLSYGQICVLVSLVSAASFCLFVRFWLRDTVGRLFSQLSARSCFLSLTYPCVSLVMLAIGTNSIFSPRSLASRGTRDILFSMAFCAIILVLYVMIPRNTLEITCRRKTEKELQFARQLTGKQREHYNQILDYVEQVRIIKHDFRHHIHVLQSMGKEEQDRCLKNLKGELDWTAQIISRQNQVVSGLLREYVARTRQKNIIFEAKAGLSTRVPMDDLTLCIVIGNLLENAFETCRCIGGACFIRVQTRRIDDYPMMMMENSYNGQVTQRGGKILFSKKNGGLGMPGIRRILNHPGDEFDVDCDGTAFTVMMKVVDRAMAE